MLEKLAPARRIEWSYETGAEHGAVSDVPEQVLLDRQTAWLLMPNFARGTRPRSTCTGH